jgi:hypothetical protein
MLMHAICDLICSPTYALTYQVDTPPFGWDLTKPGPTCQWLLQHALSCSLHTGIDDHHPAGVDMLLIGYRGQHAGLCCEWLQHF